MTARPTAGETVTPDQIARFLVKLRRAASAVYLAADEGPATELSALLTESADTISALLREREALLESVHYANGVADLAMKHRDTAEAERDALRAALVEIAESGHDHTSGSLHEDCIAVAEAALKEK